MSKQSYNTMRQLVSFHMNLLMISGGPTHRDGADEMCLHRTQFPCPPRHPSTFGTPRAGLLIFFVIVPVGAVVAICGGAWCWKWGSHNAGSQQPRVSGTVRTSECAWTSKSTAVEFDKSIWSSNAVNP
eukprot:7410053-Pyramimonas_sp.AAC.1